MSMYENHALRLYAFPSVNEAEIEMLDGPWPSVWDGNSSKLAADSEAELTVDDDDDDDDAAATDPSRA